MLHNVTKNLESAGHSMQALVKKDLPQFPQENRAEKAMKDAILFILLALTLLSHSAQAMLLVIVFKVLDITGC